MNFMSDSSFSWQDPSNIRPSRLTSLGVLAALAWLMISILQEDPVLFLTLGGLNFLLMLIVRIQARKKNQMDNEGGIFGYLVVFLMFSLWNFRNGIISKPTMFGV